MRHLYQNLILVVLTYSLALSAPVLAQTRSSDGFESFKNYVNSSGKKNYRGLVQKMEKGLPTSIYENALKNVKGPEGLGWFETAKLATNYSYFRIGNSKIFIRTALEKGKTVFYANGMKIQEDDFRSIKKVENILFMAYVAGISTKKSSWLNLFDLKDVYASPAEVVADTPATAPPAVSECESINQGYRDLIESGMTADAQAFYNRNKENCPNLSPLVGINTPAAAAQGGNKKGMIFFIIAAVLLFLLFMRKKNKNKPRPEVPEDGNGVGRGDEETPGGGVNCGGEGAQCPGNTPTAPPLNPGPTTPPPTNNPGDPTAPPVGRDTYDPNQYSVPSSKTRK